MTRTHMRYTAVLTTAFAASALTLGLTTAANAATGPGAAVHPNAISSVCGYTSSEPELYESVSGQTLAIEQAQCELNFGYAYYTNINYGNGAGMGLTINGSFGSEMKAAVEDFQSSEEITANGTIGAGTWTLLDSCVIQMQSRGICG